VDQVKFHHVIRLIAVDNRTAPHASGSPACSLTTLLTTTIQ